jgi:flagellar protein FlbD
MIRVTRLNKKDFVINADLILFVESKPDTLITFLNGDTILVLEPIDEVVRRVVEYRRNVFSGVQVRLS